MKKFTSIALCLIMVAMLMTGCRSKEPEETAGPTNGTTAPTQAPTSATQPSTTPPTTGPQNTNPSTGATEGTGTPENKGRAGMLNPRAY